MSAPAVEPAATVEATSSMRTSATMEATTTSHRASAVESATSIAAGIAMSDITASGVTAPDKSMSAIPAVPAIPAASALPATTPTRMTVPRATIPSVSVAPAPQPPRTVEPRASPDEDATREPVRPIVAVRRASVGIISVVAVLADRRPGGVARPNVDANSHTHLRLRKGKRHDHHHRQQREIFHVSHTHLPAPDLCTSRVPDPKALSNLSTYLNAGGEEKLQEPGWLISAILAKINHLRASAVPMESIRYQIRHRSADGFTIGWPGLQEKACENSGMFTTTPLMR